jgi:DNA-directed RNA polymerase specialized sigma24 family protein
MNPMNKTKTDTRKLNCREIASLRNQFTVELRDLATKLLDDPIDADGVVARTFRALRRHQALVVGTGEQARRWLIDYVTNRCIARYAEMVRRDARAAEQLADEDAA